MNNELRKIAKELRKFAKRCKNVKYSNNLLFMFLLTGLFSTKISNANTKDLLDEIEKNDNIGEDTLVIDDVSEINEIREYKLDANNLVELDDNITIAEAKSNVRVVSTDRSIQNQRQTINNSISDIKSAFKQAKVENSRLLKNANLELIQLMEQGDQVVKSPWNSWQFGANYIYNNSGTYSGNKDKSDKYPYEGILVRDSDLMSRYITRSSEHYSSLIKGSTTNLASDNYRQGINYGLTNINPVIENPASMEINATIRPKAINKSDINVTPRLKESPEFPETMSFSPIKIVVNNPTVPKLLEAPDFRLHLGNNCNVSYRCPSWGGHPTTGQVGVLTTTVTDNSWQNINLRLNYTTVNGYDMALKFRVEPDNNSTVSYWLGSTGGIHRRDNGVNLRDIDEYFFNSYNFGDEFTGIPQALMDNPSNPAEQIDLNKQYFFVGGSRFFDIDNIIAIREWGIPQGKTLQLGGAIAFGLTTSQNFSQLINKGLITDVKEKDEKWIINMPTDSGKDYLTLYHPVETYQIRKSADGYVGHKVGMGLSFEDGHNYANQQDIYNDVEGTIDFRGEKSIGMYAFIKADPLYQKDKLKSTGDIRMYANIQNKGNILMSGKNSYGVRISAITEEAAKFSNSGLIHLRKNPDGVDKADDSIGIAFANDIQIGELPALDIYGADFPKGAAVNIGTVRITDVENSIGVYIDIDSDFTNKGKIEIDSYIAQNPNTNEQVYNIGMRSHEWRGRTGSAKVLDNAKIINDETGVISLNGRYGIGMLAEQANLENKGTITSTDIKNGIGIYATGQSYIKNSGAIKIIGTGNAKNTGIFMNEKSEGEVGTVGSIPSSIEVVGDNSMGVLVAQNSNLAMAGDVKVVGNGIVGIAADNSQLSMNSGLVSVYNVDGGSKIASDKIVETINGQAVEKGTYGIVVSGKNSKFDGANINTEIKVKSDKSVGLYSEGELIIGTSNVEASDGAFNFSVNNGTIDIRNGGSAKTGENSLLFYTIGNNSKIKLGNNLVADIKGSNIPQNRGTAFYIEGSGVLTSQNISDYLKNLFDNTLNNLTLNMEDGSRLMIASNVTMNLSDTDINSFMSSGQGPTINGTLGNYKTVMLSSGKLNINQNINLDNNVDLYNLMEIANSSITNNSTITGTKDKQVAISQENIAGQISSNIVLLNDTQGTITLAGEKSIGMYGKRTDVENKGNIEVVKNSVAMYLSDDNKGAASNENDGNIVNSGTIKLGENTTGMFYSNINATPTSNVSGSVRNAGRIESESEDVIGMFFDSSIAKNLYNDTQGIIDLKGKNSIGMYATGTGNYNIQNNGTIKLGNSQSQLSPIIGMFTDKQNIKLENNGEIAVGDKSIGIYGYNVALNPNSKMTVESEGVGVYSKGGDVYLDNNSTITLKNNEAVGVYYNGDNGTITTNGSVMNIGTNSYGFVMKSGGTNGNTLISHKNSKVNIGEDAVYIYSNDNNGRIRNYTDLISTNNHTYGIYASGDVINRANINFEKGIGNVGIYSIQNGTALNDKGIITVGASIPSAKEYSIGMAAGYENSDSGNIINNGTINVVGNNSVGMYATGPNSTAINRDTINLIGTGAVGMYLDEGAKGENYGTITTVGNPDFAVGIVVKNGAELINHEGAKIHIDSLSGIGVYNVFSGNVVIKNYGDITVGSGAKKEDEYVPGGAVLKETPGGIRIEVPQGASEATITNNGNIIESKDIEVISQSYGEREEILTSSIGMYVDTLRKTKPISGLSNIKTENADLIIGVDATTKTNSKYIQIDSELIAPYSETIKNNPQIKKWGIYAASATWFAAPTYDDDGIVDKVYLVKVPYTDFVSYENKNLYGLFDGVEELYSQPEINSREKQLFNKLNYIGNNESVLLSQAFDEMAGYQYANVQQRTVEISNKLTKEFDYLKDDWRNPSKQNNKIKTFGMRSQYKTDTAGIIDYDSQSYGIAYVNTNETIKLGNDSGWYAGYIFNKNDFKDIGKSQEKTNMIKAGVFKSIAFDDNGSLKWTISGDGYVGQNDMHRKYLVVDEIFNAKSTYYSYGVAVNNGISKEIRTTERTSITPYGNIKLEYGRFTDIKEKTGEIRLGIDSNDYYSINPELGVKFNYKQPFAQKAMFTASIGAAYENELGKVENTNNKAKVRYTNADYYVIKGEKENRKGNGKFDLNLGIDNQRLGFTLSAGYDTKGDNFRAGIGLRAIY